MKESMKDETRRRAHGLDSTKVQSAARTNVRESMLEQRCTNK